MDVGEAPEVEMRTYIVAPASLAAFASAMFKSKSILRWLAKLPAARAVVPSAEKKISVFRG